MLALNVLAFFYAAHNLFLIAAWFKILVTSFAGLFKQKNSLLIHEKI